MKNRKGFTLIELLAVIVILGLLMAIAIPSVTRLIEQSRKKTLVNSINSFINSAVNSVNDTQFGSLTDPSYLYYIPASNDENVSCIPLEKGGSDPFGEWGNQAFVVVHYNPDTFSYDYYFTFQDSAGYGMELTKSDAISSNGADIVLRPFGTGSGGSVASSITSQKTAKTKNGKAEIKYNSETVKIAIMKKNGATCSAS